MPNDAMRTVHYTGSHPLHGAIIEMPDDLDPSTLRLTITPGGKIYDRTRQRPLPGARLIQKPQPREVPEPVTKPRRRRAPRTTAA